MDDSYVDHLTETASRARDAAFMVEKSIRLYLELAIPPAPSNVRACSTTNVGCVICADTFAGEVRDLLNREYPAFRLIICDPPYGLTKIKWDVAAYHKWFGHCVRHAAEDAVIVMFGGIGTPQDRPFVEFASEVEKIWGDWEILNWITWAKKRAYGVPRNYLFTREEMLILVRGHFAFNIPYLAKERGYAGYDARYPAKSKFLRRTNVWSDITELFKGKIHPTQKPDRLYEVLIETHSNPGDVVYDPCAGSLTTRRAAQKLGRQSVCVEKDAAYIRETLLDFGVEWTCSRSSAGSPP